MQQTTFIYTLTDPITNKIRYVGKTNNLKARYKEHMNSGHGVGTHKRNWIDSLKKQGLKPIMEVIDEVSIDEWQFWEHWWYLNLISWGFDMVNHTSGGDGLTFGNDTSFKKGQGAKAIKAFDKSGNLIGEYDSITQASIQTGIDDSGISKALKGTQKTAGKLAWFLQEEEVNIDIINERFSKKKVINTGQFDKGSIPWNIGKKYSRKGKTVLQYDLEGNFISEYSSCHEAALAVNGSEDSISACCRGINKTSKNFKWKYKE